ncbi:diaminopimelate decarboxylase [Thermodesulfobacteriota bacterium]
MHHFQYKDRTLFCEDVPVPAIARAVGTPFYLYSHATLTRHFLAFEKAFERIPHIVCFSAKANTSQAILHLFAGLGGGLDIVSGGELYRGLRAGIPPDKIVYSGVGKTREEIDYALETGILMFNVESGDELLAINERAGALGRRAPIAIRINPDVDPKTHPYISTGLKKNKFGIDTQRAMEGYRSALDLKHVDVVGIDFHIGSQITQVEPFVEATHSIAVLIRELRHLGIEIQYVDVGGGLGINYGDELPPDPEDYAGAIAGVLSALSARLILEPGRVIVGNAGVLVAKVLYLKHGGAKSFVVVDAGMNDLVRPAMYDAFHAIWPVHKRDGEEVEADVVGPICESSDFLAKNRRLAGVMPGDLLSVMSAGAYGFCMASNYNSRPRVSEVMVHGDTFEVIRERESYEDLVRGERIPSFLNRYARRRHLKGAKEV